MSPGTKIGAQRAAQTNFKKYGRDFYRKLGSAGGSKSAGRWKNNPELAREAALKSAQVRRRKKELGGMADYEEEPIVETDAGESVLDNEVR